MGRKECDHIYVVQSTTRISKTQVQVTYRCGRCGDTFTAMEAG